MSLHTLVGQYAEVATFDEADEDDDSIASILADLDGEIDERLVACAQARANIRADLAAIEAERARLDKRAKAGAAKLDGLEAYIAGCLTHAKITKRKAGIYHFGFRKGGVSVVIDDINKIPSQLKTTERVTTPDKRAIKEAIQCLGKGETFEGARLVTAPSSLSIR